MIIKCISTGSKGNCYLLENSKNETLIIELGIRQEDIFKNIKEISKVVGAIYTHNHGDHNLKVSKGKKNSDVMREWGINVRGIDNAKLGEKIKMGDFTITPVPADHDVPCHSYLIQCEGKNILFATDTRRLVHLKGIEIQYFIVEVNYIEAIMNEMLEQFEEETDLDVQAINTYNKHLSLETLCSYFDSTEYRPKKIFTIHGSGRKWFDLKKTKKALEKYVESKDNIKVVKGGDVYVI